MKQARMMLMLFAAVGFMLGGCPWTSNTGTSTPVVSTPSGSGGSGASTTASNPGSSSSSGGSTGGGSSTSSFETQLKQEFPSCGDSPNEDVWRDEILRLVNVERARVGAGPVTQNQVLENQATQYACEMIHYNFFDHENPSTGSTLEERVQDFGYDYYMVGENLAAGQTSPQQAMADWMASDGHRENILNPTFTELGVGVRTGGSYHVYWVQEFGHPR